MDAAMLHDGIVKLRHDFNDGIVQILNKLAVFLALQEGGEGESIFIGYLFDPLSVCDDPLRAV